ncbi:TIGR02710 family CRISPR-associated CARF protein [Fervidibacter sacchari]|jgi:CRISPR-associated protein, TIGR02710 family|uniref:CRISPR-associated protein (TIGR02710 family) n=1 Tax=Candidatus Fervidibacter sacchari TaxID=1448929 RepID=A0ABT2ELC2_9BACT|nr:TIGR02710 family CRISPR-associated CARF protein [Candidatus Fervidibacter sacchari]MCS3918743.1 CRISPR-associated protein (TIGR02710 family) [Candidatus Fervidibacter sacchari]WKU17507.1 TIGR02710 family CRISPR-associated CARF protein [Candidatus Fervidibacter sacchari]
MPKGMVITVGVGGGIEHAIALSIRNSNPDHIVFLVTEQSEKTLEKIEQEAKGLGITLPPYETERIRDENDAELAYEAAVSAIRKLGEKDIAPSDITVDYTTGSKPMSAGALYAAIMEGCAEIVYVTGQRDKNGRVISGTEKFITAVPNRLMARRILTEAVRLFNAWQFTAAKQLVDEFLQPFPKDKVAELFPDLDSLSKLCAAYQAWDAFDHITAQKAFEEIDRQTMERWSPDGQIARNKGWVNKLARKLMAQNPTERLCKELLVDLWANALRRLKEGRFIDAVARLYRLTELVAQFRLWHQYGIDTSDVDISKVPENVRERLENYRDEKGKVKIPLRASYELLEALDDEIGKAWAKPELRDALSARNNSITAHGLEPVTEEVARKLKEAVEPIVKRLVPELDSLFQEARFPQL